VKHDWISDLLMIVFALIALMAVHRGTGLARELKACQLERLAAHPGATLVGGATDVGLWVTKQDRSLPVLISTRAAPELRVIEETKDALVLGGAELRHRPGTTSYQPSGMSVMTQPSSAP
jgi:hypothetical protein